MRVLFLLAVFFSTQTMAQKNQATLECKPTTTDFIYDCTIKLTRGGKPLAGAGITMSADMPSMPMAHNVKPVKAKPGKVPGEYEAQLDLEMLGEWAVKLRLRGPVKDQLILHYDFDEKSAQPVIRSGRPLRK